MNEVNERKEEERRRKNIICAVKHLNNTALEIFILTRVSESAWKKKFCHLVSGTAGG